MRKQGNMKKLLITALSLLVFTIGVFSMNLAPQGNGFRINQRIEAFAEETRVTTANLNLRTGPGTSYAVILVIPKGATVAVT
ncbi:MAG TPA: hypothetical protein VLN47_09805, partial [Clostridiaceae bacterium]|nr:hypothetical protein [Clostridiaceae bacterium]